MPQEEHRQRLAVLRRARYGSLLALHIVRWCAAGRRPTPSAAVLFCSRSSVDRPEHAYRTGKRSWEHDEQGPLLPLARTTVLVPTLRRSRLALLKAPPRAYGWCRTRWSGATLALTREARRGITVSAEPVRRGVDEHGPWGEALVCADERDLPRLPKGGYAWRPQGTPVAVMTPGTQEKHDLAGALDVATGTVHHGGGPRNTHALFRALLQALDAASPAAQDRRLSGVVENDGIPQANAVQPW